MERTLVEADLHRSGPSLKRTFVEADLCWSGPLSKRTFVEADLHWSGPLLKRTFIEADLRRSGPSSKRTFVEADLCRRTTGWLYTNWSNGLMYSRQVCTVTTGTYTYKNTYIYSTSLFIVNQLSHLSFFDQLFFDEGPLRRRSAPLY